LRKDGCRLIFAVFQNVKNCSGSNDRLKFTRMALFEQILSRYSKLGRKLMEKVRCTRIFEFLTQRTTCPSVLSKKTTFEIICQKGPPLDGGKSCQATRGTCRHPIVVLFDKLFERWSFLTKRWRRWSIMSKIPNFCLTATRGIVLCFVRKKYFALSYWICLTCRLDRTLYFGRWP
jgi:hypothetical protein